MKTKFEKADEWLAEQGVNDLAKPYYLPDLRVAHIAGQEEKREDGLEPKGRVLFLTGGDRCYSNISRVRQAWQQSGGIGVIWFPGEVEATSQTLDEAIEYLTKLKEGAKNG